MAIRLAILATLGTTQATALLPEHFVMKKEFRLTPEDRGPVPQPPLPTEELSWLVVRPVMALGIVMVLVTASELVTPRASAIALVLALKLVTVIALGSVTVLTWVMASALMTASAWVKETPAQLTVPQPLLVELFPWGQELECGAQLIPVPTSRQLSLH
jgi:hypothetical protein